MLQIQFIQQDYAGGCGSHNGHHDPCCSMDNATPKGKEYYYFLCDFSFEFF